MRCRGCSEDGTVKLWKDRDGGRWERCLCCGSDTSTHTWDDSAPKYDAAYIATYADNEAHALRTPEEVEADMRPNLDWFVDHQGDAPGRDFLDVGCCDGSALRGMAKRGWGVHGFDINRAAKAACPPGDHITVATAFRANLFPQQYSAVLCREVLEHVPCWRSFLEELVLVTTRQGLCQIQTPRPAAKNNSIGYQGLHLQLLSPVLLRYWLERLGMSVIDYRVWKTGQAWMLKRT